MLFEGGTKFAGWKQKKVVSKILKWIATASLLILLVASLGPYAPLRSIYGHTILPSEIQKNGPNSYYAPLSSGLITRLTVVTDSNESPHSSNLLLFEDGKVLGPAHALHREISDLGNGRFSHWGTAKQSFLIFSTSDNSDPRSNGRAYSISAQMPNAVLVLIVLPLVVFLLQRLITDSKWMLALQATCIGTIVLFWMRALGGFVVYNPDSATYYNWLSIVPLGYPLFLTAVEAVGSLSLIPIVQVTILGGAILFLCFAVNRISTSAGLATLFLLVGSSHLFYGEFALLSEALFVPVLLINLGAAIFLVADPGRRRWPMIVAISAASIMFVRPAGYYAPLGIIFLMIAWRSRFLFLVKWLFTPFMLCLALAIAVNFSVRGTTSQSQVGRPLFPLVALVFDPSFSSDQDREVAIAVGNAIESHRVEYKKQNGILQRYQFSTEDFNRRLDDIESAVARARNHVSRNEDDYRRFLAQSDKFLLGLFLRTIWHDPLGYLGVVKEQLIGGWVMAVMAQYRIEPMMEWEKEQADWRVEHAKSYKVPLSREQALPDMSNLAGTIGQTLRTLNELYNRTQSERWLIYLMGLLSLFCIPLALFRSPSPRLLALGYCGVMIHGSILLACATTVFIRRYALTVDPVLLVFGAIITDGIFRWSGQAISRRFRLRRAAMDAV